MTLFWIVAFIVLCALSAFLFAIHETRDAEIALSSALVAFGAHHVTEHPH